MPPAGIGAVERARLRLRTATGMTAVLVPVVAMLAVQALGAMANLTLAVMAPAAAPAFGIEPSWIGFYSGVMYIGAVASPLVSGGFVARWGPIRVCQAAQVGRASWWESGCPDG